MAIWTFHSGHTGDSTNPRTGNPVLEQPAIMEWQRDGEHCSFQEPKLEVLTIYEAYVEYGLKLWKRYLHTLGILTFPLNVPNAPRNSGIPHDVCSCFVSDPSICSLSSSLLLAKSAGSIFVFVHVFVSSCRMLWMNVDDMKSRIYRFPTIDAAMLNLY